MYEELSVGHNNTLSTNAIVVSIYNVKLTMKQLHMIILHHNIKKPFFPQ